MTHTNSPEGSHGDPLAQLTAPPIFIVGVHRSGTTWVYDMLTAHPEVAGVFESGIFSVRLGVAPLFHPQHWYPEPEALERDRALFGSTFRLNQLIDRDDLQRQVRELTASWLSRPIERHHRFLVEKTPEHFRTMRLIDELYPGAAFLHVIRDGRDVAVSMQEAGRAWAGARLAATRRAQIGQRWAETITIARRQASDGRLRYLEVRYEDLQQDSSRQLETMFEFCGIPFDREIVEGVRTATAFDQRSRGEGDEFRRRGRVGEWVQRFGIRDRLAFDRVAGPLLVDLGYEDNRRWWLHRGRARG